jgi:hypothetical protein
VHAGASRARENQFGKACSGALVLASRTGSLSGGKGLGYEGGFGDEARPNVG